MNIRNGTLIFVAFLSIGVVLAMATPPKILSLMPGIRPFTDFMGALIPSIERLAAWSKYPDVTRFFFSVMWATVPIQVLLLIRARGLFRPRIDVFRAKRFLTTAGVLSGVFVLTPVAIFLIGGAPEENQGMLIHEVANRLMQGSRVWLGLLGSAIVIGVSLNIVIFVVWLRLTPKIFSRAGKHEVS